MILVQILAATIAIPRATHLPAARSSEARLTAMRSMALSVGRACPQSAPAREDLTAAVRGLRAGLRPPMPWFNLRDMTDCDVKAIYAHLSMSSQPASPRRHICRPTRPCRALRAIPAWMVLPIHCAASWLTIMWPNPPLNADARRRSPISLFR